MGLWETYGKTLIAENTQAAHVRACGRVNGAAPDKKAAAAAGSDREERARAAAKDSAWRQWLDACPRYPGGCLSCHEALLDLVYFCQGANRAVFGADVIEAAMIHTEGANASPAAGRPSMARTRRRGVQLNLNLSGVPQWRDRSRKGAA